ncbi:hypothetical protein VXP97_12105, partial [Acinetobacter sp. 207]
AGLKTAKYGLFHLFSEQYCSALSLRKKLAFGLSLQKITKASGNLKNKLLESEKAYEIVSKSAILLNFFF